MMLRILNTPSEPNPLLEVYSFDNQGSKIQKTGKREILPWLPPDHHQPTERGRAAHVDRFLHDRSFSLHSRIFLSPPQHPISLRQRPSHTTRSPTTPLSKLCTNHAHH
jgi:hypothetical protein